MSESTNGSIQIDACFSPFLYPVYREKESIVVVIDILRATSAICTAFHYGAEKIIPVATIEEAQVFKDAGYLAAAERNAVIVDGFEIGNSPFSYMGDHVKGKTIVITTTNGTQAIHAARGAYKVVIGSFLNLDSLCEWLSVQNRNVLLLCSGWKNKFNLEDALFAGAMTEKLIKLNSSFQFGDACIALMHLYEMAKTNPYKFLNHSFHKERLARLNLKDDIRYCLTPNQTTVIPILEGDGLVKMKKS